MQWVAFFLRNIVPKYKHIIWDFNGTLLDDLECNVSAFNALLDKYGLPAVDVQSYRDTFFFPVIDFYRKCGFDFSLLDFEKVGAEFIEIYTANFPKCKLFPQTRGVLAAVKRAGIGQSVLSACKNSFLTAALKRLQIAGYFDFIDGLPDHGGSKTELARAHMAKIKALPSEVVLIGDTVHDIEAAEAIGVDSLLLDCGHNSPERLSAAGGRVVSYNQLYDILA